MIPIPVKIKNVTLYRYFDPLVPLEQVILTGASGTYSVGTLLTSVFYNMDISDEGKKHNPLILHTQYIAKCETENGDEFTTPWMYCIDNSDTPKFGRTVTLNSAQTDQTLAGPTAHPSEFIKLAPLTDITVSQLFPGQAIGQRILIEKGSGYIVATKTGTPHEMGVQVDSGERVSPIVPGLKNIMISGKTQNGEPFSQVGYTAVAVGEPAIFLKEFFK